jgi:hypothetical protein
VALELPIRKLIERRAEPLGGQRQNALALDIGRGACAKLRIPERELAGQCHRAPEPEQQTDRHSADSGQRDIQPHACRHLRAGSARTVHAK